MWICQLLFSHTRVDMGTVLHLLLLTWYCATDSVNDTAFPAHTAHLSSRWPNCRWTPMTWESGRTWERLCWWKLRRRSTGCTMTGTAGTSQSRPHLETTWNFPASAGLWMTRKWCCEMEEVEALFFFCFISLKCNDTSDKLCPTPHFVLCLF